MIAVMLAAQVWTYWFAPPLMAMALALLVATGAGYYRKVVVPRYLSEQQRQLEARSSGSGDCDQPFRRMAATQRSGDRMPLAA